MKRGVLFGACFLWLLLAVQDPLCRDILPPQASATLSFLTAWSVLSAMAACALACAGRPRLSTVLLANALWPTVLHTAVSFRDPDECFHLRFAWQISQGGRPYLDFFCVYHPLWHVLFAIPIRLLGAGSFYGWIMAGKLASLACSLGAIAATAALGMRLQARPVTTFVLALTVESILFASLEFRCDPGCWLFVSLGLLLLSRERYFPAGLAAGTAFLFSQKALSLLGPVGLALVVTGRFDLRRLVGGFVAVILPFYALLFGLGMGPDYQVCCLLIPKQILAFYQASGNSAWLLLKGRFLDSPLLYLLALGGIFEARRGPRALRILAVATLVSHALLLWSCYGHKQYSFQPTLWACLLAAVFLDTRLAGVDRRLPPVFLSLVCLVFSLRHWTQPLPGIECQPAQTVLSQMAPGDSYYGEDQYGHYHDPTFRPFCGYYSATQSLFDSILKGSSLPRGAPLDLTPFQTQTPNVIAIQSPDRARAVLDVLEARGCKYRFESGYWILTRRPAGPG